MEKNSFLDYLRYLSSSFFFFISVMMPIITKCENFHSRVTLSKTLSNGTAGTLVPIDPELLRSSQFSQVFDLPLL